MKVCSIEGCGKKHYGQGLCAAHYQKFRKYGSPYFSIHKRFKPLPDGAKVCSTCEVLKDKTEYHFRKDTKTLTGQCKACKAAKVNRDRRNKLARTRRENSTPEEKEKLNSYGRAKYEELKMTPTKFEARADRNYFSKIKRMFGISKEEYIQLFDSQRGRCDICGAKPADRSHLGVDHNHASGQIRGLLCSLCNLAVGNVKDSPEIGRKLVSYIEKHLKLSASKDC